MDVISTSRINPSGAETAAPGGLLAWLNALIAKMFGSPAAPHTSARSQAAVVDELENPEAYVIAPGGYHIRLPDPSDMGHCVGQELPHVREALASVPPLPHVVMELLKEVQNPASTAGSVANIASSDPALATVLLRTVNSAAFGLSRKINSVSDAVNYLGFAMVRSIVVRLRLDQVLPRTTVQAGGDAEDLWVHSLAVSYVADTLASRVDGIDRGLASTLGLLHDIGKLAIVAKLGSIHGKPGDSASAAEAKAYGIDHAGLGANLAHTWKLPADLVQAIRWHHHPEKAFEATDPPALRKAVYLVQIANQLAKYGYAYTDHMELDPGADIACQQLGLGNTVEALLDAKIRQAISKAILFTADDHTGGMPHARRFLKLHTGDEAQRLSLSTSKLPPQLSISDGAKEPLTTAQTIIKLEAKRPHQLDRHRLDESQKAFHACATPEGIETLAGACERHQEQAELSPTTQTYFNFALRSLIANFIAANDARMDVEVQQTIEPGGSSFAVSSPLMSFARRLPGATPEQGLTLVAAELANIINLDWFKQIQVSADGSALRFFARE